MSTVIPMSYADPECERLGAGQRLPCFCGFCKPWDVCTYGDCRAPKTTHCPVFGYGVCDRHATSNGVRENGRIVPARPEWRSQRMSDQSPFPAPSEDLDALRKQYEDARDTYAVTKVYAHWTAACEAHGRWLDARSRAAS